ncbi:biotin--[acetyl-CoA-carboxylase] ligase [Actinotalea sp. BY-33]|uniref:biotin--[biotin carboxyl-carrier protein] ligase n=1 Tax=Actinotalea soli TaxID=2819234 RepID=A0A939LNQ9_9CELL|nr:biotin--[acetyl-CoA-carboxylase] ligase [Actinotalea soli]MBO1751857.1 biotin--[acetyl-CoA-carboxylase] ligase [Actinotalea soli]
MSTHPEPGPDGPDGPDGPAVSDGPDGGSGRPPLDASTVTEMLLALGAGRVEVVDRAASTSADLVAGLAAQPHAWPDHAVLVADHQEAGRGRSGRTWTTPRAAALTFSMVLRPTGPVERWGWVPLLTGLAVVQALREVGVVATVKWPNDVLVEVPGLPPEAGWGARRKVAGILSELVTTPAGPAVVVGIGINVDQTRDELPVPSASSVALAGGRGVDRAHLLGAVVGRLLAIDARWRAGGHEQLASDCAAVCSTLGEPVVVDLPGGESLEGTASGLAGDGALEVIDRGGRRRVVLAGDVHHVRSPG